MRAVLFFILLLLIGCGVTKNKEKEKSQVETELVIKTFETNFSNENVDLKKNKLDSAKTISNFAVDRSKAVTLQNFNLKNNGRCSDPGIIRYINFTDVLGNKTSIPVNDNTDLNFNSESELKKEIESLRIEITDIKKENEILKQHKKSKSTKDVDQKSKIKTKSSNTITEIKKRSFWAFIMVGVISILAWELFKQLIKKYFFK